MGSLEKTLRSKLENTVKAAREIAEAGARSTLEQIGVGDAEAPKHLSDQEKDLRRRLRIHGRQLGDESGEKKGTQTIERLVEEVAYEHWHRLLFAYFLADNKLLMYPDPDEPVAVTIAECDDMAADEGARNGWELAARYATKMLPQIFRVESPVFELELPPESQQELEKFVAGLPKEVFTASDSLGWVYQFWQANRKEAINKSEVKIGARELPAVTQLFTEDYMVDFLLDNTLGAWHAGKVLAANPSLAKNAVSEQELRDSVSLSGCNWNYLRFVRDSDGIWKPAAGTFDGWPKKACELKCLDPCMGSGRFAVAMFERLVALRSADEGSNEIDAVTAVISENLFGLEIDQRCTQIAAFNVALSAWQRTGYIMLPPMNLACCGLSPNADEDQWLKLGGRNERLETGMASLYQLFQNAPFLGSLVNPRAEEGDLLVAAFHELKPLLEKALARETNDETAVEMAVTARGLAKAAEILAGKFTLVATNVPYLKSSKQDSILKEFCERVYPKTKSDLATVFIERCIQFCENGGSATFVTPQTWLFLGAFTKFRSELLADAQWNCIARLGPGAFGTISGEVVNVALLAISAKVASADNKIAGIDADPGQTLEEKARLLGESVVHDLRQANQLKNPDARISFGEVDDTALLQLLSDAYIGQRTGDGPRFIFCFWELSGVSKGWEFFGTTVERTTAHGGLQHVLLWEDGKGQLAEYQALLAETVYASGGWKQGWQAWGKFGVRVSQMGELPVTLHSGSHFDNNCAVIVPKKSDYLPAIWAFCESPQFRKLVRQIDQSIKVTNATLVKVPFDLDHWKMVAVEKYPQGLPKPFSSDATQWLFDGNPHGADQSLQVAVARLVGYQWPRQTGSSFPDCPSLEADGLEAHADKDGIVCIPPVRGEASAADRLLNLLAGSYGSEWNGDVLNRLLVDAGYAGKSLETWLRDGFFSEHIEVFHKRPFVWHIWDGLRDGFSALVNYHKLDHKNLETLIYTYLGDWISRCESDDQAKGLSEDSEKTTAAKSLKRKLELILEGQAPYDIFVRWKPLHEQPIGWNPDINDGVRINIRPFVSVPDVKAKGAGVLRVNPKIKWDKDRGKEPQRSKQEYPWFWNWDEKTADFIGGPDFKGERFNDCHYSLAFKRNAREAHQ
jgi:hypothetical protein